MNFISASKKVGYENPKFWGTSENRKLKFLPKKVGLIPCFYKTDLNSDPYDDDFLRKMARMAKIFKNWSYPENPAPLL